MTLIQICCDLSNESDQLGAGFAGILSVLLTLTFGDSDLFSRLCEIKANAHLSKLSSKLALAHTGGSELPVVSPRDRHPKGEDEDRYQNRSFRQFHESWVIYLMVWLRTWDFLYQSLGKDYFSGPAPFMIS